MRTSDALPGRSGAASRAPRASQLQPRTQPCTHPCAGVLAPFSRLVQLELRFFNSADLAALPPSVRSVTMRLPGTDWALAQVQRAHRLLRAPPADEQVATWVAAAGGQPQMLELSAGAAPGPAALLAELSPTVRALVASTHELHPTPQPAIFDWAEAFLQRTQLAAPVGWGVIVVRGPRWLRKAREAVEAALVACMALNWAVGAVRADRAARRAAVSAVDGRLSFVVAPPGVLGMGLEHQQAAAGLGQLLHASLAAVVALGTLRPLVKVRVWWER